MGRLAEVAGWAAVCLGVWLLTLSTVTAQDMLVAGCAAVLAGLAATAGRQLVGGRWTFRLRWLRWAAMLVAAVPIETAQVIWAAAAGRRGRRTDEPLPARESKKLSVSRAAVGTVLLSASPGSYVVDVEPDERVMHVHRFGGGAPAGLQIDPGTR